MTCPHCGAENIPNEYIACPECGRSLRTPGPTSTGPGVERPPIPVVPVSNKRPYLLAGVLGAVVVILIIALIAMLNRPKQSVTAGPKVAPPVPGPAVTQTQTPTAPPVAGPPITQAPSAQPPKVKLPVADPNKAAVQAYLARIAPIEEQRQQVVNNLVPALIMAQVLQGGGAESGMMKELLDPDPTAFAQAKEEAASKKPNQVQQLINGYVAQLGTLDSQLRAIRPVPQPAFPFATSYDSAFAQYASSMLRIGQMMNQGLQDPSQAGTIATQLSGMKGQLHDQAQQGLRNADAQLTALCAKYGIPKPFDISDTPSGNVVGVGG